MSLQSEDYATLKATIHLSSYDIRYDAIVEFNVDSKAEYSALSSTRSQTKIYKKKKLKHTNASAPFISVQIKIREGSPEVIRVTMEERICERDEF